MKNRIFKSLYLFQQIHFVGSFILTIASIYAILVMDSNNWIDGTIVGIAVSQMVLSVLQLKQTSKQMRFELKNGILYYKFLSMESEKTVDLTRYNGLEEKWYGFDLISDQTDPYKFSTDGIWKGDKRRLKAFLENQLNI